ncbi:MAG: SAM-dependent methyltransferase [Cyanobacteriota bacterium]|nr:SAM-dependent methyltransferase [Cyanobacteriota bacterium]
MTRAQQKTKIEYGDFQTPIDLAEKVCEKLASLGVNPDLIIEPTCGIGNFVDAASRIFQLTPKIIGVEINPLYVQAIKNKKKLLCDCRISIKQGNFFDLNWSALIDDACQNILILGNLPWVTNSQQGKIRGVNLPTKVNFQKHKGLDAITGKSNFDISEWMLIDLINRLQGRNGYLAILCKTAVARKILNHLRLKKLNLSFSAIYKIDTKKYFGTTVDAGLFFCDFSEKTRTYFCSVFEDLETSSFKQIGYYNETLVRDIRSLKKVSFLWDKKSNTKWRSGVKHDCSRVMQLCKVDNSLINGLGKVVDIEDNYVFPLLKGSDVAKGKVEQTDKYILVPQSRIGEPTEQIKKDAPKTWQYLIAHAEYLDSRKSKIYQNNPRFSVFGVGDYTFKPWKIAICGLYKKLDFRLVGEIENKSTIFDDTVYFISFDNEKLARTTFESLLSQPAIAFYSSLIFWDEKRPIKTGILNRLNLERLREIPHRSQI